MLPGVVKELLYGQIVMRLFRPNILKRKKDLLLPRNNDFVATVCVLRVSRRVFG